MINLIKIDLKYFSFYREVAEVFIESEEWLSAMKCELTNPTTGIKDTPLRMLIKSFPELANNVFDKCMRTNLGFSEVFNHKKSYYIHCAK